MADAPRQVINATILYQTFRTHKFNFGENGVFDWNTIVGPGNAFLMKKLSLGAMIFTVAMFAVSLLSLICAVILYIPLVSHIQGNLKEFCCHKIDKRYVPVVCRLPEIGVIPSTHSLLTTSSNF